MLRFLAVLRRAMLIGVITLIASIIVIKLDYMELVEKAWPVNSLTSGVLLYISISPIAYILSVIVSAVCIRAFGQFAAFHKSKPFLYTCFKTMKSDFTSPFRCIAGFFQALFNKLPGYEYLPEELASSGRRTLIIRFIIMILYFALCIFGVFILKWNI